MSYLEQLKSENTYQGEPPKHPKGTYGGFGGRGERDFSEKKAPVAVVDLATPTGPRTVIVSGNTAPDRTIAGDLPEGCPLDGWPFPETGCRFHRRIFERLTAEGVLPPGGPCPLRGVCKLGRPD